MDTVAPVHFAVVLTEETVSVDVREFDMQTADDLSGLEAALAVMPADRIRRLALLLRVAGEYTDGSRERARGAVAKLLAERKLSDRSQYVTVIGAEGAATPCGYAFIDNGEAAPGNGLRRLALGLARVPPPPETMIGTAEFARRVKTAVETAMRDGGMKAEEVEVAIV